MRANRLLLIVIAFLLAGLAADTVLAVGIAASDYDWDPIERVRFFASAFLQTAYGPMIALLLALCAVVVAEVKGISSVFYFIIGGALIGFVSSWSVDLSPALENTTDIAPLSFAKTIATVAGIVGGLVYWAIAGRRGSRKWSGF